MIETTQKVTKKQKIDLIFRQVIPFLISDSGQELAIL